MKKIVHRKDIVEYKNFFSNEECTGIIKFLESNSELWEETCFFNARVMAPDEASKTGNSDLYTIDNFNEIRSKFKLAAEDVFSRPLRNLSLSAHLWMPGAFAAMHSDNHDLDGNPQPGWIENKLVTILYLNDNYEGGELVFENFPIKIAPEQGTLIVFDVGYENIHGVTEVGLGSRLTLMSSFDYADSVYGEDHYILKEKELQQAAKDQEKQRKDWKSK
jgi:hypothetical protein